MDRIDELRIEATRKLDQSKRGELGQYFTPSSIANFMASIFDEDGRKKISILDAGAGIGSLSVSLINRLKEEKGINSIESTAYEYDSVLLPYLESNLNADNFTSKKKVAVNSRIINGDFISEVVPQIMTGSNPKFTHAILNPPYKKIHSSSSFRKLLQLLKYETVNLYSAFVGVSIMLLEDGGQLVAIIPRSFCNGNYYIGFRSMILDKTSIDRIHVFETRNKAFKDDDVLQENVIIHLTKGKKQGDVVISRSTDETNNDLRLKAYPFTEIVNDGDDQKFIRIPAEEGDVLGESSKIKYSLADLKIEVSTGPVVDFRAKEFISKDPLSDYIPLLYPVHFNGKEVEWPKESKKPNAIKNVPETSKMLFPNGFYTVVRRFSSKEEKSRIVARVVNPNKLKFTHLGFENHLNVFHISKSGLPEDLAFGIATYLNSGYVDDHFRSFNGHTQVNVTDLRQMKYPSLDVLIELGKWAKMQPDFHRDTIDQHLNQYL